MNKLLRNMRTKKKFCQVEVLEEVGVATPVVGWLRRIGGAPSGSFPTETRGCGDDAAKVDRSRVGEISTRYVLT